MQPHKRDLTIFFCDVLGSTSMADQLPLDDFVELMQRYHRCVYQSITVQYGYVVQHLGDGVMAYFGYPTDFPKAPVNAVRAGINLLQEIKEIQLYASQKFDVSFDIRISIHTGSVIMAEVGLGNRKERLALGEAPNISARLQGLAPRNGVAISKATYDLVKDQFNCDSLGTHQLKGISEAMEVFRPVAAVDHPKAQ